MLILGSASADTTDERQCLHADSNQNADIEACQRLLKRSDLNTEKRIEILTTLGFVYLKQENNQAALKEFSAAIQLDATAVAPLLGRGAAQENLGQIQSAIDTFTQASRIDPEYSEIFIYRASALLKIQERYLAERDLRRAYALDPKDDALKRFHRRQIESFDADKERCLSPRTTVDHLLVWCGRVLELGKLTSEERGLANYRMGIGVQYKILFVRSKVAEWESAGDLLIEYFTAAIRHKPDFPKAFFARGGAYEREGDTERALADFSETVRLNPRHYRAYESRASIYEKRGDRARAIQDLKKSYDLGQQSRWLIERLARLGVSVR